MRNAKKNQTALAIDQERNNVRMATSNILSDLEKERTSLAIAKAKDDAILASIGDGLVVTDQNMKVTFMNHAAEIITEWSKREARGKIWPELIAVSQNDKKLPPQKSPVYHAIHSKKTTTDISYSYTRKNKTVFPVKITASPIKIEKNVYGSVVVFRDVTRERDIDRVKTEFVSLASHQLKNPPTAIKWITEILLDEKAGKLTKNQKKYLDDVHIKNEQMIQLINALLDVSRLELGTFAMTPKPMDYALFVHHIVKESIIHINEKNLSVQEKYPQQKVILSADDNLLRIVIQNLLTNAINYTPAKGKIIIEVSSLHQGVRLDGHMIKKDSAIFSIADTGCGIPKHQQQNIFTKLFRADNAQQTHPNGTGLGLYIVKSILDKIDGAIWFTSEENKGSTFYVSIPLSGAKTNTGKIRLTSF